jgi:N-acetylglucosamine PTS system EIICBA or EIICB component
VDGNRAFFQRLAGALIIPIVIIPIAAVLLAGGELGGVAPVKAAGLALIKFWLPLFFAMAIAVSFSDGEGMAAIAAAVGYLVMVSTAEAVSGDPALNFGVLGGVLTGMVVTSVYNRVRRVRLPEYLALFDGPRLGLPVAALLGLPLGLLAGLSWPPFQHGLVSLGQWVVSAGGLGVFVYGAVLRLLVPTGLHHILTQLVDTQLGSFLDPASGKLIAGEYVRFLAGDSTAGFIHAGHFILTFTVPAAALAIAHEALAAQRRRVRGLMGTGAVTAMVLGVTEPVDFAYIFTSPLLWGMHALLQGTAAWVVYELGIRHAGYALPMFAINYHLSERGWLLVPVGLAFAALYYVLFRAVIRLTRPAILGRVETEGTVGAQPAPAGGEEAAFVSALGGAANLAAVEACMTRLRVQVHDPAAVDEQKLRGLGAAGVVRAGKAVQVVVGARAGDLVRRMQEWLGQSGRPRTVTLLSPVSGDVVPLDEVPDQVFAQRLAGDGIAVSAEGGTILAPASGTVAHVFPGGHALGIITPEGLELLVHIGIGTVELQGEGFAMSVGEGDRVTAGQPIGQFAADVLYRHGKSPVTPVLVTNAADVGPITGQASGRIRAGDRLFTVVLKN